MIALLPMYDWLELADQHRNFWALIRDNLRESGIDAPQDLDSKIDYWDAWTSPQLVLGQTCGLPYRTKLHDRVNLVGTLDYQLADAPAGYYYSQLVVRAGDDRNLNDFESSTLAFNGHDSQSGWAAPQNFAALHGFDFASTFHSGAHSESARAVADGQADIAAIDAVTWRLICAYMPNIAKNLRVLTHTTPTPGLPLITALDPKPIATAVRTAIQGLTAGDRQALGVFQLVDIPASAYLSVPIPNTPDRTVGQI